MDTNTTKEITTAEPVSRPGHLRMIRFKKLDLEAYAGLSRSLVVVFPENERITEFSGDQGMGKTSLLHALISALGGDEPTNSINQKTKTKSETLLFEANGETYQTRLTNSSFVLKNIKELPNGKPVTSNITSPKGVLAELIGPIGTSPEFIARKKSGEDQIDWIKSLVASNPELKAKEDALKKKYDETYKARTEINRDVANLSREMTLSGLYVWNDAAQEFNETEEWQELVKFVNGPAGSELEIKNAYQLASKRKDEWVAATNKMERLSFDKKTTEGALKNIDTEIERLNQEIIKLQANRISQQEALAKNEEAIALGEQFIKERDTAMAEFDMASTNLQNSGKIALGRQKIENAGQMVQAFKKKEEEQQAINITLTDTDQQIKELAKEYLPDIEGLEIELATGIDQKRTPGVYYHGTNISALSESERWDLCLQVWKVTGVGVVFIENSSSLGSDAIKRINWFASNGGHVFISTMQRSYKELTVSFHKELS